LNQRPPGYRSAPLAVPKILCLLKAAQNFDRCANKFSLNPPPAAVKFVAQQATLVGLITRKRWDNTYLITKKKRFEEKTSKRFLLVAEEGLEPTTSGL